MYKFACIVFLVLIALAGNSQSSRFSLQAGIGTWWPYTGNGETAYTSFSNWGLGTKNLGAMLDFAPNSRLSFAPAASLDLYHRRYQASSSQWVETSDLHLLHLRLSPGLRIHISKIMSMRLGFAFQTLGLALGELLLVQRNTQPTETIDYSQHPENQLTRLTVGPDFQFWVSIPLKKAGFLEPGINSYLSLNRSVPRNSGLHFEPGIWQLGLQLGYRFAGRSDKP